MTSLDDALAARSAVIVPDVVTADAAATIRERLDRRGYARYALFDRGSYAHVDAPDEPALVERLRSLAAEVAGRDLVVAGVRALRLDPGDYLLARHDTAIDRGVEVVLDLSPATVPGADVHYRQHGRVQFRMPSAPGSAAIVPRTAAVSASHAYVSRLGRSSVVRLVVTLRDA